MKVRGSAQHGFKSSTHTPFDFCANLIDPNALNVFYDRSLVVPAPVGAEDFTHMPATAMTGPHSVETAISNVIERHVICAIGEHLRQKFSPSYNGFGVALAHSRLDRTESLYRAIVSGCSTDMCI